MSVDEIELKASTDLDDTPVEESRIRPPALSGQVAGKAASATVTAYVWLPLIFLGVTLLGGLRFGASDNAFIFNTPPLICLVFAALSVILYIRSGMISVNGWIDERRSFLQNAAGAAVLFTIYSATVQIYNAVLPETGLTFWVVGFCFLWTLWNNIFADMPAAKMLRSLLALFGLAFVVKYLMLANLTAAPDGSWWRRLFENPGKEAFTWLLDLPKYGAATGYVQFAALCFYMIGLYLTPSRTNAHLLDNDR
jgi:hypothetical protein